MKIDSNIYLRGFDRFDKGEDGLLFLRYREEKKEERKAEIRLAPSYYGERGTDSYILSIPKPQERKLDAGAVVIRTSKSRYTVIVFDENRVEMFKAENVDDLNRSLIGFFKL